MSKTLTRTERLDRLPYTRAHNKLLFGSGIGWALDAMDIGLISFIMAALAKEWSLTGGELSLLGSVGFVGMAFGASLGGLLADRIEVEDTGIGMDAAQLALAWEPFYRANQEQPAGPGLGLSIAHRLGQRCGWPVQLRSLPGKGTCATILLESGIVAETGGGQVQRAVAG